MDEHFTSARAAASPCFAEPVAGDFQVADLKPNKVAPHASSFPSRPARRRFTRSARAGLFTAAVLVVKAFSTFLLSVGNLGTAEHRSLGVRLRFPQCLEGAVHRAASASGRFFGAPGSYVTFPTSTLTSFRPPTAVLPRSRGTR